VTIAAVVDWSGPFYAIDEAKAAVREHELGEVVYLALGKRSRQHKPRMQYVGISSDSETRFNKHHHKLPEISREFRIWVGEVVSQAVAGRRAARHPVKHTVAIDRAEWTLAYFLALPLNERKRRKPPPEAIVLFNRWFRDDFETRRYKRPHRDWPDLIEFCHENEGDGSAAIVWFGSPPRRKHLSKSEVTELAEIRRLAKAGVAGATRKHA